MTKTATPDLFDDRVADDPHVGARALQLRRMAGAACLPGFIVAMMIGTALDPLTDDADFTTQLGQTAGHLSQVHAMAVVEIFAPALLIGGVLTLTGAVRHRGAGLANVAAVLALVGSVIYPVIGLIHLMLAAFTQAGTAPTATSPFFDQLNALAGPLPALFILQPVMYLTMVVLAWRSGLLPKASLILGAAFITCMVVAHDGPVGWVSLVLGLAWNGWAAVALIRRPNAD